MKLKLLVRQRVMTSRNIYVISDTHFGHGNIITYCDRPFKSIDDMNSVMIENWNKTVRPQDIVYHLGDVYFGEHGQHCLEALNGRKRLILGNHDNGKDQILHRVFEKISVWRMFPEFGLLLTHVPVHETSLGENPKRPNMVNVHGHIHNKQSPSKKHKNVSVEMINYTPVNIEELRVVK